MGFLEGRDYLDKIINELQERTDEILFREFVESISQKN
jgi:hypothetical protein